MDKMTVQDVNSASEARAAELLWEFCASSKWIEQMVARRPFESRDEIFSAAREIWWSLDEKDWLEAFEAHPRIGAVNAERESRRTQGWSTGEQAVVLTASLPVLIELDDVNRKYESRFDYTYIVCASGKSAEELLKIAKERLNNDPETEIKTAAEEQAKITRLRLEKALQEDA
ncbi:MAG TPA: 2-oxo-4-hydroxy-4-carboxy-5-ureidoimidazoline decarboxylase [Gemmatimonadaceae bacterium]|jgi:2-oxo-4-hydroxy-4-carboxy-5-ureidoimidazoline decarboxylase